ncbi:hypothetical protein HAX54_027782 [Datura stramonium]|uniref:Uncharacterized protein n=1 Tax=Datura stramonium TaxID=4076 RepID=A0ABS8V4B5_DATST|nr:hypothetical protein [Datura stramonium]
MTLKEDMERYTIPQPSNNMDPVPQQSWRPNRRRPKMLTVREVDPSWTPGGVDTTSYHQLRTLPDKWVVLGSEKPLELPPDPLMPSTLKTASWHFDEATYSWIPRPNH